MAAAPLELTRAAGPTTFTTPATPDDHRDNGKAREATRATLTTATVTTGERASWWQLAEDHLGDGLRWREIASA